MLPIKYMTMRERWQKSGCMISNREVIMEKTVKILRSEISELVIKVQRFYALETVKKILEVNPERIEEFGLKKEDFSNLDNEIREADNECRNWWKDISYKYNLPESNTFRVRYQEGTVTIY